MQEVGQKMRRKKGVQWLACALLLVDKGENWPSQLPTKEKTKKKRREEHSSETYSLLSAPQQYSFMVKDTEKEVKRRRYFGEKKKEEKIKDPSEENEGPK